MSVVVLAQHAVGPAARSLGEAWRQSVGAGIGIRQVAEPAPADGAGVRGARRYVEHLVDATAEAVNGRRDDGPGAEPLADQRGRRRQARAERAASATARSTAGALPRSPSRSIRTRLSVTES